jgi:hypothetical protein
MADLTCNEIVLIIIIILILVALFYFYRRWKPLPATEGTVISPPSQNSARPTIPTGPSNQTAETLDNLDNLNNNENNNDSDIESSDSENNPPFILYCFHHPECGACKRLAPNWDKASDYIRKRWPGTVDARAYSASEPNNDDLLFYYNIDSYPTIILATPDYNVYYQGNRSPEDLVNFTERHIRKYQNK